MVGPPHRARSGPAMWSRPDRRARASRRSCRPDAWGLSRPWPARPASRFVAPGRSDLDHAVEAGIFGKFLHQGQICIAINQLIVDDQVYDSFDDRFVERVKGFKVGDTNDAPTVIGPIIKEPK